MKEVLTKRFWEGVKRTFDEAREGPTTKDNASQTPAEGDMSASSTPETTTGTFSFGVADLTSQGNPSRTVESRKLNFAPNANLKE